MNELDVAIKLDKPSINPKYYKYWIGNNAKTVILKTRKQLNAALSDQSLVVCRLDKIMETKERFDHEKGWIKYG